MAETRDVKISVTGNAMPIMTTILAYRADNAALNASLKPQ